MSDQTDIANDKHNVRLLWYSGIFNTDKAPSLQGGIIDSIGSYAHPSIHRSSDEVVAECKNIAAKLQNSQLKIQVAIDMCAMALSQPAPQDEHGLRTENAFLRRVLQTINKALSNEPTQIQLDKDVLRLDKDGGPSVNR